MHTSTEALRQTLCQSKSHGYPRKALPSSAKPHIATWMTGLKRTLTPEILDSLPEGHPDALHNRRDLRLFNALMGNFSWLVRSLVKLTQCPGEQDSGILELGAGDGALGAKIVEKLPQFASKKVSGLDLWSRPKNWPNEWRWLQEDIVETGAYASHPIVIGNMILHQFDAAHLKKIGEAFNAHSRILIFNETKRSRMSLFLLPLTRLLGTNYVSNHDAKVSVESGFSGDELPRLLGLSPDVWNWTLSTSLLGAYRFVARRR